MACPVHRLDIFSYEHKRDPFPVYARLRVEAPITRITVPNVGDGWLVTRYEDVAACLKDDRHFRRSTDDPAINATPPNRLLSLSNPALERSLLDLDGVDHRQLRQPVAGWRSS
ncbi:MAG TPA: hypothetical protein VGP48_05695 [Stellaceae bacterium]|jgi:cytochrome P450 PksS|nr:hypothetical protein [Stellaceae bacterium]